MSEHFDTRYGWVIHTHYRDSGDDAWWNEDIGLVDQIGSATHLADQAIAHERARAMRNRGEINDYTIERYQPAPRRSSQQGGGRA